MATEHWESPTEAAGMKYLVFAINPMTLDPAPIEPFLKAAGDEA